ncbi:ABC transporter permease [Natronosporangium hydrolyticum]|uniref:ABC transporter permease n=1 Tax=Natronosporangium hydrolyticum TaxID=2811111 RepID=A0A895YMK6_9ACTN|nr:ABC transporter permease [Natronosporangium hydrolyticum]QSB16699.1 ABC transporter permease [Natronosporangium hydrolyticum]
MTTEPQAETPAERPAETSPATPSETPAENTAEPPPSFIATFLHQLWRMNTVTVTALAIVLALAVGAILMIISDPAVRATYGYFFARPTDALGASWTKVSDAYASLFRGAIADPSAVAAAVTGSGDWAVALRPLSETLTSAAPLIFTGLAFAVAFRGGLFNIGVQGQAILGAVGAGLAGFLLPLPVMLHLVVAVVAGGLLGAAWGFVPGFLKARTGAHEVITTIMLNWIAVFLLSWLLIQHWVQDPDRTDAISQRVAGSAQLPRLPEWTGLSGLRVHLGVVLAVLAVAGVAWLLKRATFGFELRAVGLNRDASRAAGISVTTTYVLVMVVAGGLAGLGGMTMVLGTATVLTPLVIGSVGFDGILVGLLGRAKPWGVLAAALLFGALQAGGRSMQTSAGISLELVQVIQALIVIFVAAPALVKAIFRLRAARVRSVAAATGKGW